MRHSRVLSKHAALRSVWFAQLTRACAVRLAADYDVQMQNNFNSNVTKNSGRYITVQNNNDASLDKNTVDFDLNLYSSSNISISNNTGKCRRHCCSAAPFC